MSEKLMNDRDTLSNHLGNLLAVIHRDGGHYQGEHGTDKAVADGMLIVARVIAERDVLKGELADALRRETGAVESVAEWEREYNDMQKRATTAESAVDQYKMQLSTALNECLDTVHRENSLVVALNKKDAEVERLRTALMEVTK
jgi:hypothetical protein